jgi:hypothetical protein
MNERVQSVERETLFCIVADGHLTKKAFYSRTERDDDRKKTLVYSYRLNCLSNGLSVGIGDENLFFSSSSLCLFEKITFELFPLFINGFIRLFSSK